MDKVIKIAVLSSADNPALRVLPSIEGLNVFVATDRPTILQLKDITALVLIPPFNQALVDELWDPLFLSVTWVHTFSAGVDFIGTLISNRLLNNNAITLTNGRGAFSSSLAEYIIASAFYFNKQICRLQQNRASRKWEKFTMSVLKGKTMGFIGYGDIAKSAAVIAKNSFGMRVSVFRRNKSKFDHESAQADIVDEVFERSEDVFSSSDFVVCTLPGTPQTKNFCSSQFELMKPGAVFISCGRGVAVDEAALFEALVKPDGICAALDVFAVEPLPTDSKLWDVPDDRLLLSSHNADLTEDYFVLGWNVFQQNLQAFTEGTPLVTVVDKEFGY